MANTIQSNIKRNEKDFGEYGLFLTGIDVSMKNIEGFDPFRKGFARLFILKYPYFMYKLDPNATLRWKHFMEFGFTQINGIQNATLETEQVTGGYTGGSFEVASIMKDQTTEITIQVYEFSGSPIREFIDTWATGISDPLSGISHYHGYIAPDCPFMAKNHTMECIYLTTDPTGRSDSIEYACMLSNMMPKQIQKDHLNYQSGDHGVVQFDIPFTVNKYESPQINKIARTLLDKYKVLTDYHYFHSGYTEGDIQAMSNYNLKSYYNVNPWAAA